MTGWEKTVEIRNPSHINLGDGTKLYQHWLSCQKWKKLPVLKFVRAVKSNLRKRFGDTMVKKKRKIQWLDVSDDDKTSEDEDGDEGQQAGKGRARAIVKGRESKRQKGTWAGTAGLMNLGEIIWRNQMMMVQINRALLLELRGAQTRVLTSK
jgi:hypothetical protein